jgi:putative FmdB family regulatory protein
MPIFEYACPECRRIFQFLSRRLKPTRQPKCPQCGGKKMVKEVSQFAAIKGAAEPKAAAPGAGEPDGMPDMDDPRVQNAMHEMERDMGNMDENNPKHMAHMMRKMQDLMPADAMPKEMNDAIKRLEAGEDPEKIEADMGEIFDEFMGPEEGGGAGGMGGGGYTRDGGLYDM